MARTANSSPPNRATTSDSRNVFSKTPPARIRVRSPSAWPNVSLICFRPSTSMKTRRIPRPDRRLSFSCRSARARKPRRLYKPVNSSVSARLPSSACNTYCFMAQRTARLRSSLLGWRC